MARQDQRKVIVPPDTASVGGVIILDGVEDFFGWIGSGNAGDFVVEQSTSEAYSGNKSLHLKTRVTGPAGGDWVECYRACQQRPSGRYQIECFFRVEDVATWAGFRVYVEIWDGSRKHYIYITYDKAPNRWVYLSAAAGWQMIPGSGQNLWDAVWHHVVIELDQNDRTLRRLVCNGLELKDLGLEYSTEVLASAEQLRLGFRMWNVGASAIEAYIDDILFMEI